MLMTFGGVARRGRRRRAHHVDAERWKLGSRQSKGKRDVQSLAGAAWSRVRCATNSSDLLACPSSGCAASAPSFFRWQGRSSCVVRVRGSRRRDGCARRCQKAPASPRSRLRRLRAVMIFLHHAAALRNVLANDVQRARGRYLSCGRRCSDDSLPSHPRLG